MVSNGFWHIVSVVKELRPPCPAEWLPNNFATIASTVRNVNTQEQRNLGFPQGSLRAPVSFLEGERYRQCSIAERTVSRGSAGSGKLQKSHRDFGKYSIQLARGILSLFVISSAMRHFYCLYRRSPIDDSVGS